MKITHFIYLIIAVLLTIHINNVLVYAQEAPVTYSNADYTIDQSNALLHRRSEEKLAEIDSKPIEIKEQTIDASGKWQSYLINSYPNSPMIELVPMIFNKLPEDKAQRLMAIAGTESSFATKGYIAVNCNNPFGYLYYGTSRRGCYSPRWNTLENAVSRFIELEENGWLIDDNFEGYCVTNCEHWYDNYNYFLSL